MNATTVSKTSKRSMHEAHTDADDGPAHIIIHFIEDHSDAIFHLVFDSRLLEVERMRSGLG